MSLLQRPDCRPDRLVLLCSDTNPGKFAAHINEEVLRELNPRLPVESKEVPNLDVQFKDIRAALEHIFEQDYRLQPGDRVTLNITGGYKGTIPFLTYFAMKNKDWQLYFQHRENNSTVRLEFKDGEPQAEEEEYTLWPSQN
jgi:putative CRISPR-associated protein (TIGR02619 family)